MKRIAPWIIAFAIIASVAGRMLPTGKHSSTFDFNGFGRLPVLTGGRIMPMDSLARVSLMIMNGHGTYEAADGRFLPPDQGLLEIFAMPEHANSAKLFYLTNPDILDLFGWQESKAKYFSFDNFKPFFVEIEKQAGLASQTDAETRNAFQRGILKLQDSLRLFIQLKNTLQPEDSPDFAREVQVFEQVVQPGMQAIRDRDANRQFNNEDFEHILLFTKRYQNFSRVKYAFAIPNPKEGSKAWQPVSEALLSTIVTGRVADPVRLYSQMISAYRAGDISAFNGALQRYERYLSTNLPEQLSRPNLECIFNQVQPFVQAMVLYLAVFLLAVISWLVWPRTLGRSALIVLCFAFVLHTAGLVTRMYLQGRPPVTNLYSSAVFVGWGAVLLCLLLERFYKNGIGTVCASTTGFVTLLIAQNLQVDGDTLEMLRAVLDTNIWLATHVVCESLGYSSVFLAGLLGIIYIFRGLFTTTLDSVTSKTLSRMIYGVVCFATLFSLIGTILGGIWADQSWGRFWGWDPKENGALLVVIWNAIVLHARWG
ncbi:MAG: cytochrome c biogenesis protein CcsA, partial [Verrucomicrobia bacterium]|nr:cytochrome c biogenesis protein CcsA [Verrucomicrobiota bacterium]